MPSASAPTLQTTSKTRNDMKSNLKKCFSRYKKIYHLHVLTLKIASFPMFIAAKYFSIAFFSFRH